MSSTVHDMWKNNSTKPLPYVLGLQETKMINHIKKRILEMNENSKLNSFQLRYKKADFELCSIYHIKDFFLQKENIYLEFVSEPETYLLTIYKDKPNQTLEDLAVHCLKVLMK